MLKLFCRITDLRNNETYDRTFISSFTDKKSIERKKMQLNNIPGYRIDILRTEIGSVVV